MNLRADKLAGPMHTLRTRVSYSRGYARTSGNMLGCRKDARALVVENAMGPEANPPLPGRASTRQSADSGQSRIIALEAVNYALTH